MSLDTSTPPDDELDVADTTEERRLPALRRRRAWQPEQDTEVAALLRRLSATPWLVGGRDDAHIAAARRLEPSLTETLSRLAWSVIVERDLVRLRKSPPPRPDAWAADGPTPLQCSWFFLLVAAAESAPPRVAIGTLVAAARAAAADAGLPSTNDMPERRAIVHALHLLDERGVVERIDGDVDTFLTDEQAPVLLAVRHTRLAHVVANPGTLNPAEQPHAWLEQVQREPDPARRMRRALIDDTCVHTALLDDAEANWLSRRGRSDDGQPLAAAFGLGLERRAEGAAFVVPDEAYRAFRQLGPRPFPVPGTVAHAALLLVDHASIHGAIAGGPGPGWRGLTSAQVVAALEGIAGEYVTGKGGWGAEYAEDLPKLALAVGQLLAGTNLLLHEHAATQDDTPGDAARVDDSHATRAANPASSGRRTQVINDGATGSATSDCTAANGATVWWFAPATGRWAEEGSAAPKSGKHRAKRRPAEPRPTPKNATFPAVDGDEQSDLFSGATDTGAGGSS